MAGLSDYLENKLIDWHRGTAFPTPPASVFAALYTCTNGVVTRSTAYTVNSTVVVLAADARYHLYKVTVAGTTAATAPSYPGAINETITDGTATLVEQDSALDAAGGTEVTGGAYARVAIAATATALASTSGPGTTTTPSTGTTGQTSNNATVSFPTSTAAWATAPAMVWAVAWYDAATAGNLLEWGPLATPQNVGTGASLTFAPAALSLTVS